MFRLNFTSRVLGKAAAERLRQKKVTSTIRGAHSDIVKEIERGMTPAGWVTFTMEVALDGEVIGQAVPSYICSKTLDSLTIMDARQGGFDSISELALALKRAGYRFKPIEEYSLLKIEFKWR